jgi:hypothetical protein
VVQAAKKFGVALRDAQLLCQKLITVARQEQSLSQALNAYVSSKQAMNMIVMENAVGRALTKTTLRSINLVTSLKKSA